MARFEEVISIFLASPGDVTDERSRIADVVVRWNRAWTRHFGIRLELLRWEDDAYPDIGDDAQDVINQQIPDDWDMFVGVMWSRFGTPTGRSGSGTQEEFESALVRHRDAPGSVRVLFYFKDAPLAPSKIDVEQLQQVQLFKKSMQAAGLLTWDFTDADQFEKLIELHITKHVQDWRSMPTVAKPPLTPLPAATERDGALDLRTPRIFESTALDDYDAGYLDLLETFSQRASEIQLIVTRLSEAQARLTEQTTKGQEHLEQLKADPTQFSAKSFRQAIAKVADEMLTFTACVVEEVPNFGTAVDTTVATLTRLAAVSAELYPQQLSDIKAAILGLLHHLTTARQATQGFKDSTNALPRMTKELNVAKRKQSAALGSLVSEFENGERLLAEALTVIDGLSGRPDST